MTVRGSCLCGAVSYRTDETLRDVWACHCTQCRKTSGHFVAATAADRNRIQIEGSEAVTWFESSPGIRRGFCSRCGSQLFWDDPSSADLSLCAGAIDEGLDVSIGCHIFCASKGVYYEIDDDIEQWPEGYGQ
ncbi:MAG: GFA family protein [Pseudomonadota bacterium]